jgi:hypothetical protein
LLRNLRGCGRLGRLHVCDFFCSVAHIASSCSLCLGAS